eukprot:TRINITY_DN2330_c0_g1::TRINITY_DN2330_c0_g1_i1::g.20898::m.20898 TRINITY_DN2330_c0_g1::TRINITY_DN2330_c0_g1_i1::g.20898  ORF type:complete len:1801 (-),score=305.28,sp/A0A0R4IBK5/R213A_DANRE/22.77/3e-35,zf-C3HC4_3/PF13920.1/0.055,zf-C3HC4_2/PF13923.1/0.042,zf-C3HC4_2/PF13923.1/3.8e+03,zf-RING_5/PF14634.1/0.042,zf-RING_5/PF14634.1/9.8e+03 TRINITY_DN2330_c0_g1_i1:1452-6740(-)
MLEEFCLTCDKSRDYKCAFLIVDIDWETVPDSLQAYTHYLLEQMNFPQNLQVYVVTILHLRRSNKAYKTSLLHRWTHLHLDMLQQVANIPRLRQIIQIKGSRDLLSAFSTFLTSLINSQISAAFMNHPEWFSESLSLRKITMFIQNDPYLAPLFKSRVESAFHKKVGWTDDLDSLWILRIVQDSQDLIEQSGSLSGTLISWMKRRVLSILVEVLDVLFRHNGIRILMQAQESSILRAFWFSIASNPDILGEELDRAAHQKPLDFPFSWRIYEVMQSLKPQAESLRLQTRGALDQCLVKSNGVLASAIGHLPVDRSLVGNYARDVIRLHFAGPGTRKVEQQRNFESEIVFEAFMYLLSQTCQPSDVDWVHAIAAIHTALWKIEPMTKLVQWIVRTDSQFVYALSAALEQALDNRPLALDSILLDYLRSQFNYSRAIDSQMQWEQRVQLIGPVLIRFVCSSPVDTHIEVVKKLWDQVKSLSILLQFLPDLALERSRRIECIQTFWSITESHSFNQKAGLDGLVEFLKRSLKTDEVPEMECPITLETIPDLVAAELNPGMTDEEKRAVANRVLTVLSCGHACCAESWNELRARRNDPIRCLTCQKDNVQIVPDEGYSVWIRATRTSGNQKILLHIFVEIVLNVCFSSQYLGGSDVGDLPEPAVLDYLSHFTLCRNPLFHQLEDANLEASKKGRRNVLVQLLHLKYSNMSQEKRDLISRRLAELISSTTRPDVYAMYVDAVDEELSLSPSKITSQEVQRAGTQLSRPAAQQPSEDYLTAIGLIRSAVRLTLDSTFDVPGGAGGGVAHQIQQDVITQVLNLIRDSTQQLGHFRSSVLGSFFPNRSLSLFVEFAFRHILQLRGEQAFRDLATRRGFEWINELIVDLNDRDQSVNSVQDPFIMYGQLYSNIKRRYYDLHLDPNAPAPVNNNALSSISPTLALMIDLSAPENARNRKDVNTLRQKLARASADLPAASDFIGQVNTLLLNNPTLNVFRSQPVSPLISTLAVHCALVFMSKQGSEPNPLSEILMRPTNCRGTLLLTMPVSVLNAVADKTRIYICSNGHQYAVGNCGQLNGQGRCHCGVPIGAGSNTQVFQPTEFGHVLGTFQNAPDWCQAGLSPMYIHMIRFLLHACMLISLHVVPDGRANIAPLIAPAPQNGPETFLAQHLVGNFTALSRILNQSPERTAILMHSFLHRIMTDALQAPNANRPAAAVIQDRQVQAAWERLFAAIATPLFDNANQVIDTAVRQVAAVERSETRAFFAALDSAVALPAPGNNNSPLAPYVQYSRHFSFEGFRHHFVSHLRTSPQETRDSLKLLEFFLEMEPRVRALVHLPAILRLQKYLARSFNLSIDAYTARSRTLRQALSNLPDFNDIAPCVEAFLEAWNVLFPHFVEILPQKVIELGGFNQYVLNMAAGGLRWDSELIYFLPNRTGEGICSECVTLALMYLQNDVLRRATEIMGEDVKLLRQLSINEIEPHHLIGFDTSRDLIPLIRRDTDITAAGAYTCDFMSVQRRIRMNFLVGRSMIDLDELEASPEHHMRFHKEGCSAETITNLREKVPQVPLTPSFVRELCASLVGSNLLGEANNMMQLAINFIQATTLSIDPNTDFLHYLTELGLDSANTIARQCTVFKKQKIMVQHVLSLWEAIYVEIALQSFVSGREPLSHAPAHLRKPLPEGSKRILADHLPHTDVFSLLQMLLEITILFDGPERSAWPIADVIENMPSRKYFDSIPEASVDALREAELQLVHVCALWEAVANYWVENRAR